MLKEKEGATPIIVLTVITLITALLLALTYEMTKETIASNKLGESKIAINEMFPGTDAIKELPPSTVEGVTSMFDVSKGGSSVGKVIMAEANGYGGPVPVLIGFNSDGTLAGVSIKGSSETQGFGKAAEEPEYLKQFAGKPGDKPFSFTDEPDTTKFDMVSKSTKTSTAIKMALNAAQTAFTQLGK